MTKDQYRSAITRLGWSIVGAGPMLGVSRRQSEYYASGQTQVPEPIENLIAALLALEAAREMIAVLLAESGERPAPRSLHASLRELARSTPTLCPR